MDVTHLAEERPEGDDDARLKAILEAIVYITDEPLSAQQMAAALAQPLDKVKRLLDELVADYAKPERGLSVREVAGGYKMSTKAEHHEAVRTFVKKLTPPLKLSLAALETLAVVVYKQPVTAPEIMDIRGVQGAGVLKTLLDRKLIAEAGRKKVVGQPILYKTTKEFLVQFGLKDLSELPTIKEFEELGRMELVEEVPVQETPIVEAPGQETPIEVIAIVEEAVIEAALVDETPAQESPTEEAVIVEETVIEAAPVEEKPEERAAEPPENA
jgi:segregation and condensation protein B